MMIGAQIVLVLALVVAQAGLTGAPPSDLAAVRQLYASASYEEALSRLSGLGGTSDIQQVEQYRALCLLGLGRTAEAEQALERLVDGNPLYTIADADVSPRLVSMFHEVRRRLLPGTTKDSVRQGEGRPRRHALHRGRGRAAGNADAARR